MDDKFKARRDDFLNFPESRRADGTRPWLSVLGGGERGRAPAESVTGAERVITYTSDKYLHRLYVWLSRAGYCSLCDKYK